jgi:hypothetical protein
MARMYLAIACQVIANERRIGDGFRGHRREAAACRERLDQRSMA